MHEVAAPEALDLARGREEARVADGAVALHALAKARVRRGLGRDARVAGHAVEEVLARRRKKKKGSSSGCKRGRTEGGREGRDRIRTTASRKASGENYVLHFYMLQSVWCFFVGGCVWVLRRQAGRRHRNESQLARPETFRALLLFVFVWGTDHVSRLAAVCLPLPIPIPLPAD